MSFPCPSCGKETQVLDVRWSPQPKNSGDEPYMRRRRQCLSKKCSERFSTVEYAAALYKTKRRLGNVIEERARQLAGKAIQKLGKQFAKGEEA